MSRRFGTEKILVVQDSGVLGGVTTLVAAASGFILEPRKFVGAGTGAGPSQIQLLDNATSFLNIQVPAGDTVCVPIPEGLELTKGSGININVIGPAVQATLYYVSHDETPGITKVASRAASNQALLSGPKAIRTPSNRNLGDLS